MLCPTLLFRHSHTSIPSGTGIAPDGTPVVLIVKRGESTPERCSRELGSAYAASNPATVAACTFFSPPTCRFLVSPLTCMLCYSSFLVQLRYLLHDTATNALHLELEPLAKVRLFQVHPDSPRSCPRPPFQRVSSNYFLFPLLSFLL
jgi:hypothetical protein